jgi:hypothetical protein
MSAGCSLADMHGCLATLFYFKKMLIDVVEKRNCHFLDPYCRRKPEKDLLQKGILAASRRARWGKSVDTRESIRFGIRALC